MWWHLKFENKLSCKVVLPYWPPSCTMMFVETTHTGQISMQVVRTVFPGRLTSHFGDITWPKQ
jgi:hypothetical protein